MTNPYERQCANIFSMIGCIHAHSSSGRALDFQSWKFIHTGRYHVRVEGVLVSPVYAEHLNVHTCGTFECSVCKSQGNPLSLRGYMYSDKPSSMLLCNACVLERNFENVEILFASFNHMNDFPMLIDLAKETDMIYEDQRNAIDLNANREMILGKCALVAEANDLVYLDGACISDLRAYFLTYRVFQRWKNIVKKRRTVMMFRVLYHYMHDINAAMVIAKEKCLDTDY